MSHSVTIHLNELLPSLVALKSSFVTTWEAFIEQWQAQEKHPYLVALGKYARHLVNELGKAPENELKAVFNHIESLHQHGCTRVKEEALIEFLDALWMFCSEEDANTLIRYFGPKTTESWKTLTAYWKASYELSSGLCSTSSNSNL